MSLSPTTENRAHDQLHPFTIQHDSLFKAVWDWIILVLVIFTAIEIPYSVAFLIPLQRTNVNQDDSDDTIWGNVIKVTPLLIFNLWVDLMFIVDILINFRTTYIASDTDEVISSPKQIALHYLKSWFVVDFVAAIPFEFMITPHIAEGAATLFGLLKTARLLRLVRVARKLDRYSEYGTAVVILLTCLFTLIAHWLACIWHGIGFSEKSDEFGWLTELSRQMHLDRNSTMGPSLSTRYITALYFTLSSLTSVGFGNVSPNTNAEKVFSICVMIVGALMYASIFGNLTAIIQRLYSRTSRFHRDLRVIEEFVRFYKIPKSTREALEEYFRNEWAYTKGVDMETVMRRFPESLQADVCLHLHRDLFTECGAFKSAGEGCLRALALRFNIRHYLPGHFIIKQGDEVKRLFFIAKGNIEVVKHEETILILGKGDVISCDYSTIQSLYIPKASASLRVQTHGEIHSVAWSDLVAVLTAYPSFREDFISQLELAYNLGHEAEQEEITIYQDEPVPGRILSNARSTFSSHLAVDKLTRAGSPTFYVNGKIPQSQTASAAELHHPHGKRTESEPKLHNNFLSLHSTLPSLHTHFTRGQTQCVHGTELRLLEQRLNNIEIKLTAMEEKLTGNFETILGYLRGKGGSAPELRTTCV